MQVQDEHPRDFERRKDQIGQCMRVSTELERERLKCRVVRSETCDEIDQQAEKARAQCKNLIISPHEEAKAQDREEKWREYDDTHVKPYGHPPSAPALKSLPKPGSK